MPKAIRIYQTGGPEVLKWEEVSVSEPGEGEVRIRHRALVSISSISPTPRATDVTTSVLQTEAGIERRFTQPKARFAFWHRTETILGIGRRLQLTRTPRCLLSCLRWGSLSNSKGDTKGFHGSPLCAIATSSIEPSLLSHRNKYPTS
jgi:hypothetical protein